MSTKFPRRFVAETTFFNRKLSIEIEARFYCFSLKRNRKKVLKDQKIKEKQKVNKKKKKQ